MLLLLAIVQLLSCSRGSLIRSTAAALDDVTSTVMPEPTSPPGRRQVGFMNDDSLYARDLASVTCGYQEYDPAYPLTCPGDQACGYNNQMGELWGPACCSTQDNGYLAQDCTTSMVTTCIEHDDSRNFLASGDGLVTSERALYCPTDYAFCGTFLAYLTASGVYTTFFCDYRSSMTVGVFQTTQLTVTSVSTARGPTVTVVSTLTNTATLSSASSIDVAEHDSSSNSPTHFQFLSSTSPPPTSGGAQASETTSEAPKATPTGESHTASIAGGVVGGVGGALAIAGVVGFLIHRKRKTLREKRPEIAT